MPKKIIILLLGIFFCCQTAIAARPFIVDTDAGIDDVIALIYLLKNPTIDIKAITIECDGMTDCAPAKQNILGLLQLVHRSIPVAGGSEKPLVGEYHLSPAILKENDTLVGTASFLPKGNSDYNGTAVELLTHTLDEANQPIEILALGPHTNLASLITLEPTLLNKIKMVWIMGGAVKVKGNVHATDPTIANQMAEWNFYLDPKASDILFNSALSISLIPLDVTNQVPIDTPFYEATANYPNPAGKYFYELIKHNKKHVRGYVWYFWDPLAAVIASDPALGTYQMAKIRIAVSPTDKAGATLIDNKKGRMVRVYTRVEKAKFKKELLSRVND